MARNDGNNYAVARNGTYIRTQIANIERHNERKNESYQNQDILLDQTHKNVYFKKPTDTYLSTFDRVYLHKFDCWILTNFSSIEINFCSNT